MIDTNSTGDLAGATVYGTDGDKIGTVGQVYLDTDTQAPLWVTIKTGLFGTSESFAPLESATYDGGELRIPFEKAFVKDAPRIADDGSLSQDEEDALYAYYGAGGSTTATGFADAPVRDEAPVDTQGGYDTSGPTTDDAMTRSEEQLHVGTEKVEAGRARLRKHVVTEMQTVEVPVSHEEVTLTREPITEANVGQATSGPNLSDEEHEVVLTEERVVVNKETVPVERVALGTETVTEKQQVTEEVGHEEIELVDPKTDTRN
ncbi:DUF2382 domain-containing protein [Subtercola boreus]|uniref:Photosystem reaction center subunit H n=1 Tax=Subtercola boreus TaxID=120213 RepID=A0A3E0W7V8_9MICO|nr:PRC and DUF2382 domain-containing protein [Subtercola boreus]RFA18111.1 photosystem reaction center subunit H [Subtercola boreus]RFA18493.1 photosystem reaction center subunit H [Subtercola boreus]RFA25021.1 photosystem reaction center subunit H [Subtercola boreus]